MKKILLTSLILVLFTTGCFNFDTSTLRLKKAADNLSEAKNFTVAMTVAMTTIDKDAIESTSTFETVIKNDLDKDTTQIDMSYHMGELYTIDIVTYQEKADDNSMVTYTENLFGEGWLKSTNSVAYTSIGYADLVTNAVEIKEVKSTAKGVETFEILIQPEDMSVLTNLFSDVPNPDDETGEYTFTEPLLVTYSIKDGNLYEMSFNLYDQLDAEEKANIKSATMYVKFSNINSTNVTIPQTVIDTAVMQ